jgi:hypothetical protein
MTRPLIALALIVPLVAGFIAADGLYTMAEAQGADSVADPAVHLDPATRPPATVPDPIDNPGGFFTTVRNLWRSGAAVPAVIIGLFGIALGLRRKVPWFSRGEQALILTAILGALTLLIEGAATGKTPSLGMAMAAVFSGALLYLNARNGSKPQPPPLKLVRDIMKDKDAGGAA